MSSSRLAQLLKGLLSSGSYSDLIITCRYDRYAVHRSIVCPQSGFFAGAMQFTAGKEAEDRTIDLPEDDPAAVKALITFMYEDDYKPYLHPTTRVVRPLHDDYGEAYTYDFPHTCRPACPAPGHIIGPHHSCKKETCREACESFVCQDCHTPTSHITLERDGGLLLHSTVCEIADKYGMNDLKKLALEKFSRACIIHWEQDEFVDAAKHACATTLPGLRSILAETVAKHPVLFEKPAVKDLFRDYGEFAVASMELLIKRLG